MQPKEQKTQTLAQEKAVAVTLLYSLHSVSLAIVNRFHKEQAHCCFCYHFDCTICLIFSGNSFGSATGFVAFSVEFFVWFLLELNFAIVSELDEFVYRPIVVL